MKIKLISMIVTVLSMVCFFSGAHAASGNGSRIQMAILLDTSGSMEGLIEQAKSQLWRIVNEMTLAKKGGQRPDMEVALFEYGKSSIPASEGYLRMIVPLSNDLDRISEELFKLKTNGGDEFCGQVIQASTQSLQWSPDHDHLKVIVIAGNEPFTQGPVDYRVACKEAVARGITINTIFCGNYDKGVKTNWKDGADLADGRYMNIDQNQKMVHVGAPQDEEILRLGQELNKTYIAYGRAGAAKKERQSEQDSLAFSMAPGVMLERAVTKSSKQYQNKAWDLVDAEIAGEVDVAEVKDEDLPQEMRGMTIEERKQYVEGRKKERKALQEEINRLNKERRLYVENQRKNLSETQTLDQAVIKALKSQAETKGFAFE